MEAVAHGFHHEKAHNQVQQPLEPVRQHVNDDFPLRQDAKAIRDGSSFDRIASRHQHDQRAYPSHRICAVRWLPETSFIYVLQPLHGPDDRPHRSLLQNRTLIVVTTRVLIVSNYGNCSSAVPVHRATRATRSCTH